MKINGRPYQTIWLHPDNSRMVQIIDQRRLPFDFVVEDLKTPEDCFVAIRDMHVRGAPLIGVTASFGFYLALLCYNGKSNPDEYLKEVVARLEAARPTAVNLSHALQRQLNGSARVVSMEDKTKTALETALEMAEEEKEACRLIGEYGLPLIEEISHRKPDAPVNILTHCNAGWLASIDYGTATAPVYLAHDRGIRVHVWVDETRPRNQGTRLTAWELKQHGIPFTVITDNAGGYLMQKGMVDLVLVGSDRTAINGDVANKTGTYLKALAAHDNNIPFYAALPSSSIDPTLDNGSLIPIEERDPNEVRFIEGYSGGKTVKMRLTPLQSPAANPAFDITPARLVSGLITERGICKAERADIVRLFPEFTNQ